ncbi:MAG TPA: hypothetical protein VHG52_01965, partial [Thermomicrobiales bacterium]|nr:hypothetical protein [Thermomicrobiales bacterium]
MTSPDEPVGRSGNEDDLFDDIREFLSEQSGDRIYEELSRAYALAQAFAERELAGRTEYSRMLRAIERLVEDAMDDVGPELRARLSEVLYLYGLAHYSLLQHVADDSGDEGKERSPDSAKPLVIYDVWFPNDVALERSDDGCYLHISDGRLDVSLYLGDTPNSRGALVDIVDHWGYAASNTEPTDDLPSLASSIPLLTIELDYAGSEIVDAS